MLLFLDRRAEHHGDGEGGDGTKHDAPGKLDDGHPFGAGDAVGTKEMHHVFIQSAQVSHNDEASDHGDDVAKIIAARFGEQACHEHAQQ